MNVTIILCTYNRCQSLAKALESICASIVPPDVAWEVLVVDNNSSDKTRHTIEAFCKRFPGRFRYLFEPRQGKSYALNAGIRDARGDILVFIDDDVTVEKNWLQNLSKPLFTGAWVGIGGRIMPEEGFVPPRWLAPKGQNGRYALAPLALFDLGMRAARLEESPFGTNMAFRKEVFEKYGGFRTDLGPHPESEIRSEDTEFGNRMLAAGELLYYEPSAVVYHSIPSNRLQKTYFRRWWYDKGRSNVREFGTPVGLSCLGVPLYLFRRVLVWTFQWMVSVEPAKRFSCKLRVCGKLGEIVECRRTFIQAKMQRRECDVQS